MDEEPDPGDEPGAVVAEVDFDHLALRSDAFREFGRDVMNSLAWAVHQVIVGM